jgi:cytochrome c oxidase cbb3-type subunit III
MRPAARSVVGYGMWPWLMLAASLLTAGILWSRHLHYDHLQSRVLVTSPEAVIRDPELVRFAQKQAKPLYAANCAACHGAQMTGNPALGAPNLTDKVWLYGNGGVFDIERTLLYGIRSKQNKSRNVAEMPAFGLTGVLRDVEIRNVVQYVLQLSGRPHQGPAASEGEAVYHNTDKGRCADCHGYDARGNSDYGAPDLTVNVWNSGSDAQALYNAIYYGQHRMMPAWIGKLTLEQIRALAIYIYSASHPADISRAAVNHE